ncbi:MAG: sulfatase-like hydrolase/transferase [Leptospiraceae bacterium]|nr:sulfatase [Leptospiraceae bacterium]MCK6382412.1 sulfatase-like hydrolase/transferase [Leptospiraceae bacterium]NUM41117.1 sulfatase [Leptospiraceae bacterium]
MNLFRKGLIQSYLFYPLGLFVIASFFTSEKFTIRINPSKKIKPLPEIVNLFYENPNISVLETYPNTPLTKPETHNTYFQKYSENNFFINQEFSDHGVKNSFKAIRIPKQGKIRFKIEGKINHTLKLKSSLNFKELFSEKNKSSSQNLQIYLNNTEISQNEKIVSETSENILTIENTGNLIYISELILQKESTENRPNVIFIVIDSLRKDAIGVSGTEYEASPAIDTFAKRSMYFTNHSVNSSWTRPSTMIFFTGMYPSKTFINFWDYPVFPEERRAFYNSDILPLPALFSVNGYESAMIGNNPFVTDHRYLGVDTGFEKVFDFSLIEKDTIPITEKSISFLNKRKASLKERPFFLFLNYNDPHRPYTPPEKFLHQVKISESEDYRKKSYLGEVAFVDSELNRFFKHLKENNLFDNSFILITSDHGEVMDRSHSISKFSGIYTLFGHGQGLYEEDIQTPLIIKLPNQETGRIITTQVRSIDIFPTLLDYLKFKPNHLPNGESLKPVIEGLETKDREYYGESRGVMTYRKNGFKLKQKTYKFHRTGFSWDGKIQEEPSFLYDLKNDPNEHSPIQNLEIENDLSHSMNTFQTEDSFYVFRIANPNKKKGHRLNLKVSSKIGKAIFISEKNSMQSEKFITTGNGFQIDKIFGDEELLQFRFKIYPDITLPEISISLDNNPIHKGEIGVGEMDVFPGTCKISNTSCSDLYLSKNRKPDLPRHFRIQVWKNGENNSYTQNSGILEKDALNILKKQGYVK